MLHKNVCNFSSETIHIITSTTGSSIISDMSSMSSLSTNSEFKANNNKFNINSVNNNSVNKYVMQLNSNSNQSVVNEIQFTDIGPIHPPRMFSDSVHNNFNTNHIQIDS